MQELLPTSTLIDLIFYSWLELKFELNALFIENRHSTRSIFRICSIVLAGIMGVYIYLHNPAVFRFITGIVNAFNVPILFQEAASISLALLIFSGLGAYISKAIARSVCKYIFGDPDFYLTKKRGAELEKIFKEQGFDINENTIRQVVEFCIHKLRDQQLSSEMGTSPKDWEQILNSLIYDADLDHFLDQQAALQTKKQLILEKQAAIAALYNISPATLTRYSNSEERVSPDSLSVNITSPATSQQQTFRREFFSDDNIGSHTPLLMAPHTTENTVHLERLLRSSMTTRKSSTSSEEPPENKERKDELAKKVLSTLHRKLEKKHSTPISEEQLLHHCTNDLKAKELHTSRCLFHTNIGAAAGPSRQNQLLCSFTASTEDVHPNIEVQQPTPTPSTVRPQPV